MDLNSLTPRVRAALRQLAAGPQDMRDEALLKLFDVGAKWASIGVLMHGFTGLPVSAGIWIAGGVSLFYITVGGLWADLQTDLLQFAVQVVAGMVLFFAVLGPLGGSGAIWTMWERLPTGHANLFNGPYNPVFFAGYLAASILSYNGGTWNLAVRYIGSPSAASARPVSGSVSVPVI